MSLNSFKISQKLFYLKPYSKKDDGANKTFIVFAGDYWATIVVLF